MALVVGVETPDRTFNGTEQGPLSSMRGGCG
jgi:hypothetical protein